MPYFPQLASSCLAQFPLAKNLTSRTVLNRTPGGERVVSTDANARLLEWTLDYSGLTRQEAAALETFFRDREGRLNDFVFFDPVGNLLARSEEFHLAPWQNDPLLQWTAGQLDPMGTTRATRVTNAGAASQLLKQSVDIPGDYQLCFSFWAKSATPLDLTVARSAGAMSHIATVQLTSFWLRWEITARLSVSTSPIEFSIALPAGAIADLFGAQLEPQPHASGYRRTYQYSGVFPNSRFSQDELSLTAEAFENYAARVKVISAWEG